jgi:O-antigen/teichoic acid export membrane protein
MRVTRPLNILGPVACSPWWSGPHRYIRTVPADGVRAMMQPMHLDRDSALTAAEPVPVTAAATLGLDPQPAVAGRTLTRDSILFGAGSLAGKGIGFVVLPVFARLLAPDQFGRLDVLNTLVSSAILIAMSGTDVAAVRLYFDRRTPGEQRRLFATWCAIALAIAAIPAAVLIVWSDPISRLLFGTADLALALACVGIALLAGILHFVTLGVLRATGRPLAYAVLEGGALIVNAGLAVVLLASWRADATAVMLALAVSWSGAAAIGLLLVRPAIVARPSRAAARALLLLALPLLPAIAATWGADFFHRAYLLGAAGATQVAYLSVATRIGSVAMLVVAAAQLAWHPHAYRLGVSSEATARLAAEGRQIIVALVLSVAVLGILTPELLLIIGGTAYAPASPAVGLFLVSVLGVGLFTVGALPSAIERRTTDLGMAIIAGVAVAVLINVAGAASLGAPGTASAIALGQFVTAAVAIRLGRRRISLPIAWGRLAVIVAVAIVAVLGSTFATNQPLALRSFLAALLGVALVLEGTLPAWLATVARRRRTEADG